MISPVTSPGALPVNWVINDNVGKNYFLRIESSALCPETNGLDTWSRDASEGGISSLDFGWKTKGSSYVDAEWVHSKCLQCLTKLYSQLYRPTLILV